MIKTFLTLVSGGCGFNSVRHLWIYVLLRHSGVTLTSSDPHISLELMKQTHFSNFMAYMMFSVAFLMFAKLAPPWAK